MTNQYWTRFALAALYGLAPVALAVMLTLGAPGDADADSGKNRDSDRHRDRDRDRDHSNRVPIYEITDTLAGVIDVLNGLIEEHTQSGATPNGANVITPHSVDSSPFIATGTAICPDWAMPNGPAYTLKPDEWGTAMEVTGELGSDRRGLAGDGGGNSQRSAACAWVAACNGDADCYGRCPVAMAIGHGESKWYPSAFAWDGNGRGLWQINYSNTAEWPGCSYNYNTDDNLGPDNPPTETSPANCPSLNPIENAKKTIGLTSGGKYFSPANKCWSTCSADCAAPYSHGYSCSGEPGGGLENPPVKFDGPGLAQAAYGACDNAIQAITGSPFGGTYNSPERCDLGSGASVCLANPDWACDPNGTIPDRCGWGEPETCVNIPIRESCDDPAI